MLTFFCQLCRKYTEYYVENLGSEQRWDARLCKECWGKIHERSNLHSNNPKICPDYIYHDYSFCLCICHTLVEAIKAKLHHRDYPWIRHEILPHKYEGLPGEFRDKMLRR